MKTTIKRTIIAILCLALGASLLGCGSLTQTVASGNTAAILQLSNTVSTGSETPEADEIRITLSDAGSSCDSDAVGIEGSSVTILAEGTYRVSGTLSDGQIVVNAPEDAKVKLILDGAEITKSGSAAIYAVSADKLIVASAAGSVNRLASTGTFADGDNVDAALFAKCDLNLNGDGVLHIACETGHGVVSKDDLKLKGGTVSVTAAKKGLEGKDSLTVEDGVLLVEAGTKGLESDNGEDAEKGCIEILGGSVTVTSGDDSVHASNSVTVSGGALTLTSGDDGIHADALVQISGGSVTVLKSYEGIEAQVIEVSGGEIDVTASDDGFNAAGGNDGSNAFGAFGGDPFAADRDAALAISGGTVSVDAEGDGLDSNGSLTVSGGVIFVSGPTNGGNGALDYGAEATITGGTLIAAGASGMAENFGSASTQGSILLSFQTQQGGSAVSVRNANGEELASFTPTKAYSSVVVSVEGMEVGESYTVSAGSYSETVTLSSVIYGSGMGFGGFGGGQMGGFGGGPGGGQPGDFDGQFPSGDEAGSFSGGPGGQGGNFGGRPGGFGGNRP